MQSARRQSGLGPTPWTHQSGQLSRSDDATYSQFLPVVCSKLTLSPSITMSFQGLPKPLATASAGAPPSLLTQVGMAGSAAVITVSFIHPIDVVKVCFSTRSFPFRTISATLLGAKLDLIYRFKHGGIRFLHTRWRDFSVEHVF